MTQLLCLLHPAALSLETHVRDIRPGAVALAQTPFYPGGGGQLPDVGTLEWGRGRARIASAAKEAGRIWHMVDAAQDIPPVGEAVRVSVDAEFRATMQALHTGLHVVNALVFQGFDGALVTGVQMAPDATARIDFDLPEADNDRRRGIEAGINDVVRQDLGVSAELVPLAWAQAEAGTLRSQSVAPPADEEGRIRVVQIAGLDRQACGGTHLASTGADGRAIRILKIENKGRHNRRVRIGLVHG